MKTIICAIAKNEDNYIKDFCEYHLGFGFDEIHIYDNGTEIQLKDDRIIVHPFRKIDLKCPQMAAYSDMLSNTDADWCAFIDIDEFITLNGYISISEFISSLPSNTAAIKLGNVTYGDGGLIVPKDISIPVYERITECSYKKQHMAYKYILKTDKKWKMESPHHIFAFDKNSEPVINMPNMDCYIRHYKTKTLSEFCDQKLNTPRVFDQTKMRNINYYFQVNKKTPEKIAYLKSRGIEVD